MSGKSYLNKSSDNSYTYSQMHRSNSSDHKPYGHSYKYPTKQDAKSVEHKSYDHSYKYPPQQKNDRTTKQTQSSNIFKYKIERDESGNCRYVLENPDYNPLKVINNYDIVCVYPSNGTKYYKNVNIYNYNTYKRYNDNKK